PEQPNRPLSGTDQPEHHAQARGLAGAVGPQVPVYVAGVDREINACDSFQLSVTLDQAPDLHGRRSGAWHGVGRGGVDAQGASCLAADSAAIGGTEPSTV